MNIIGENIRRLRKNAGLTQIEFAKRIGVSQGTLSDIEQGNCNPSIDTVISIHNIFGVSLDWLIIGKQENGVSKVTAPDLSSKEIHFFKLMRQLKPSDLEELLAYATFKVKQKRT